MYIALDFLAVPFTMVFAAVFLVANGVGGCGWNTSDRSVRMDVDFWNFSNNPPNSASVDYAMTFIIILNSTCTGHFMGALLVLVCCCWVLA